MPDEGANTDGIVCKRRHSSGLRRNNDKPKSAREGPLEFEPARRAAQQCAPIQSLIASTKCDSDAERVKVIDSNESA